MQIRWFNAYAENNGSNTVKKLVRTFFSRKQHTVKYLQFDYLWECQNVASKTTFGRPKGDLLLTGHWVKRMKENNFNLANKLFTEEWSRF